MTQLLQKAFERAAKLPQEEQDKFARFLLAELESEQRWTELFSRSESEDLLERLANKALATHRAGRTQPLNIEECRRSFVYTDELLGCLSSPSRTRTTASTRILSVFHIKSSSSKLGFQARESAEPSVLGTREY